MENDKKIEAIRAFHSKNYKKTIIICKDIIKSNKQTSEIYNISGIKAASVMQARKPIYKTSKKSFNNYSKYFSDIFSS